MVEKYSFKPGDVVAKITQIYINLGWVFSTDRGEQREKHTPLLGWRQYFVQIHYTYVRLYLKNYQILGAERIANQADE